LCARIRAAARSVTAAVRVSRSPMAVMMLVQDCIGAGSCHWLVVRGGRSVLTFLSVRPLRRRNCAQLCSAQRLARADGRAGIP
jgi:hypothetical protein